jgi:dynein heavy chain
MFRLLDCFMVPYFDTELKKVTADEVEDLEQMLEGIFVFCLVWTVGCTTTPEGRTKFNIKIRDLMGKENKFKMPN